MRETLNPSEGRKMNLNENIQNLRDVLDICKSCIISSPLLTLKDEGRIKGDGSLSRKLMDLALGNKYEDLFSSGEINPNNEKEFNERYKKVQNFLMELGKIFDEMVVPGSKGKNPIVDWFVKEMFRLNDSFCELNRAINYQENAAFHVSAGLNWDLDYDCNYNTNFSVPETYNGVISKFRIQKEGNKRLWINVYRPLLELLDKELEVLLGKSWEESNPLSEGDFKKVSKDLFIMDYLNIRSYRDFCKKYGILKDKQKTLSELKQKIDKIFMERWDLKSDLNVGVLHMNDLESFLKVSFTDLATQAMVKVFEKKKKHG